MIGTDNQCLIKNIENNSPNSLPVREKSLILHPLSGCKARRLWEAFQGAHEKRDL